MRWKRFVIVELRILNYNINYIFQKKYISYLSLCEII